ncbi:hypothetical protein GCM10010112_33270 [Actinoplanes lobatus]|uniref:Uncharacterized protein n=1 Tax=Actinoplanes lobatus TaxID=113568 RepID=A0A7W7HHR8_9ACTN|nr:hypothetical protein [Actinoplanes lobatus]MBB4750776.1 hypothetical protein [Actinoplanes lobatus]GGN68651.1 hypothetical protein GCM10010112_33270 [Actinoplanes lobatus]GIE42219.1 hypothetical protein Alo02nite_51170 [Actinoplanes lobatus]
MEGEGSAGRSGWWWLGLLSAGNGLAAALIGTTLPWAYLEVPPLGDGIRRYVMLGDLWPLGATRAVLVVIVASAATVVCFGSRRPLAVPLRWGTVFLLEGAAVLAVFLTVHTTANRFVVAYNTTDHVPRQLAVGEVTPAVGGLLFIGGLVLALLGLLAAGRGLPVAAPVAFRVSLGAALIGAVLAVALSWHHVAPSAIGLFVLDPLAPAPADVDRWATLYRVGLAGCLALMAPALLAPRVAHWAGTAGITLAGAVFAILAAGYYVLRWDAARITAPSVRATATVAADSGYLLAACSMLAFGAAFALLPGPSRSAA